MGTALALQVAMFARSLTAPIATLLIVLTPAFVGLGMVALVRSDIPLGPSAAKFAAYQVGPFDEAVAGLAGQIISVVALIAGGFAVAWLNGPGEIRTQERVVGNQYQIVLVGYRAKRRDIGDVNIGVSYRLDEQRLCVASNSILDVLQISHVNHRYFDAHGRAVSFEKLATYHENVIRHNDVLAHSRRYEN
jgi:hypothetical protein